MIPPPSVILDQSCSGSRAVIARFAPTAVFVRRGSFLKSPREAAEELRGFIDAEAIAPPCVCVGASYAAFTLLVFAHRWPELVAGLVLLDPSHPQQGVHALKILPAEIPSSPAGELAHFRAQLRGFGPDWENGCREVAAVTDLGAIPLLVLAAGEPEMPELLPDAVRRSLVLDRHALLAGYARLSTRGEFRVVPKAGHDLAVQAAEEVNAAIRGFVDGLGPG